MTQDRLVAVPFLWLRPVRPFGLKFGGSHGLVASLMTLCEMCLGLSSSSFFFCFFEETEVSVLLGWYLTQALPKLGGLLCRVNQQEQKPAGGVAGEDEILPSANSGLVCSGIPGLLWKCGELLLRRVLWDLLQARTWSAICD